MLKPGYVRSLLDIFQVRGGFLSCLHLYTLCTHVMKSSKPVWHLSMLHTASLAIHEPAPRMAGKGRVQGSMHVAAC